MDPANADLYEASPMTCHGCATRDEESRSVAADRASGNWADTAFDGLYIAVTRTEGG